MVVCVCPIASQIGAQILAEGGNAVDAAVAVALVMAVTWPEAGNIGGGGFMLISPPRGKPVMIDYRETAPASVTKDTFAQTKSYFDAKAVGVPGTLRGLELAHQEFGTRTWKELLAPAVKLAQEGFILDEAACKSLNGIMNKKGGGNAEFRKVYSKADGTPWQAGDRLVLKDLAKVLRAVQEHGAKAFYEGEFAEQFAKEMKTLKGYITVEDLKNYQAKKRTPVIGTYRGYEIIGAAPPSSGGITLIQMLNMLETFDLKKIGREEPQRVHLFSEVMKRAYRDRAAYLGDPDFTKIPEHLTSKDYAKKLVKTIDLKKSTPSRDLAGEIPLAKESDSTTHFSIVDASGLAVSNTYTLEDSFGSRVVLPGLGFILNNEMGDFNPKPGYTNTQGTIGTEPNLVAAGKRMLSSQCPVIIKKDGQLFLVTGSPGGRTIINTVLQVITNVIDFDLPIQEAVDAPRFHHQWFPDEIRYERKAQAWMKGLDTLGHQLKAVNAQGDAHSIWIDPKTGILHGAADKRLNGKATGVK